MCNIEQNEVICAIILIYYISLSSGSYTASYSKAFIAAKYVHRKAGIRFMNSGPPTDQVQAWPAQMNTLG